MRISTSFLASVQTLISGSLPSSAEILENQGGGNGRGGKAAPDWQPIATVSALVLQKAITGDPGDTVEGGKLVSDLRRLIRLPYGTAITSAHRLRIDGLTYEILSVQDDLGVSAAVDCQCKRLA